MFIFFNSVVNQIVKNAHAIEYKTTKNKQNKEEFLEILWMTIQYKQTNKKYYT